MRSRYHSGISKGGIAILGIASTALLGLICGPVWSQDSPASSKMLRQIGVMERIIDKVLIDSPNFLVHGSENTHGLYLDGYGAIFGFEASLTSDGFDLGATLMGLNDVFETKVDDEGNEYIVIKKSKKIDTPGKPRKDDKEGDREKRLIEIEHDRQKRFEAGKEELVQVLLDYGETMTIIRDGEWFLIAGYMQKLTFSKEKEITRVIVKAKAQDLKSYSAGDISEAVMRSRVQIEEY
ncbi:MAG: hypothetical protein FJY88_10255 [Candidatus Eisenbacteria bacterium]|nr:hypothetical protein [Candidatus Eisenbacteria bacterium]